MNMISAARPSIYSVDSTDGHTPLPDRDTNISEGELQYLQYVVSRVSGDPRIQVRLGASDGGNFYDPIEPSITLDPATLSENPKKARAVSAHEARHRKETPTPTEMKAGGFDPERFRELGFPSLFNVIEDMAINNSAVRHFPNLRDDYDELYRGFTESTGTSGIVHPETSAWYQRYGFIPRFSYALSELLKDWAIQRQARGYEERLYQSSPEPRFSADQTDPDVCAFLESNYRKGRIIAEILAAPDETRRSAVMRKGVERCAAIYDAIFPEFKELIEKDLQDLAAAQKALEELMKEGSSSLPEELREAIKEALEAHIEEIAKQEAAKVRELADKVKSRGGEEDKQVLKDRLEQLKEYLDPSSVSADLLSGDPERETKAQGQVEEAIKRNLREEIEKASSSISLDTLAQEELERLKSWFDKLSPEEKEKAIEAAERALKELEDELNRDLKAKFTDEPTPPHSDAGGKTEDDRSPLDLVTERLKGPVGQFQEMQAHLKASRTEHEIVLEEVLPIITANEQRVRQILLPTQLTKWVSRRPSGTQINTLDAMQSEFNVSLRTQLFEQRVLPFEKTYSFVELADISGSMRTGGRAKATHQASIICGELWSRLSLRWQGYAFNHYTHLLKDWDDSIYDPAVQEKLGVIGKPGGENEDWLAVRTGREALEKESSDYRFLFVMSDTTSAADPKLKREIDLARSSRIIVIHFGLGSNTADTNGTYPFSFGNLKVTTNGGSAAPPENDFVTVLCNTLRKAIITPEEFFL